MIEGDHRIAASAHAFDRGTVDEDDVKTAIVIAIEESHAAAGRINDVVGFGCGNMRNGKAKVLGDVFENWHWRQTAAVLLGWRGEFGQGNAGDAGLLAGGLRI